MIKIRLLNAEVEGRVMEKAIMQHAKMLQINQKKKSYYLNRIFKNLDFEVFWDSFISKDVAI